MFVSLRCCSVSAQQQQQPKKVCNNSYVKSNWQEPNNIIIYIFAAQRIKRVREIVVANNKWLWVTVSEWKEQSYIAKEAQKNLLGDWNRVCAVFFSLSLHSYVCVPCSRDSDSSFLDIFQPPPTAPIGRCCPCGKCARVRSVHSRVCWCVCGPISRIRQQ